MLTDVESKGVDAILQGYVREAVTEIEEFLGEEHKGEVHVMMVGLSNRFATTMSTLPPEYIPEVCRNIASAMERGTAGTGVMKSN